MKSVSLSAGILLVSLGIAWMRFTAEPDKIGENEVLVMAGQIEDIQKISWSSEKHDTVIDIKKDDLGTYLWVTHTDKKDPENPQSKSFKGGANGDTLLNDFSPLIGIRKLEGSTDLNLLGLDTSTTTLKIERKGSTREFKIGNETYGTKDFYVQDTKSSEVFLVDDKKIRTLINARTSLPDRSLFGNDTQKSTMATIQFQEQNVDLIHKYWQDISQAQWLAQNNLDGDNTQLQTWLDKIFKLTASRYAGPDDSFQDITPSFSISLSWESHPSENLDFYLQGNDWWAKSTHTRHWVKIGGNSLPELYADLPNFFNSPQPE